MSIEDNTAPKRRSSAANRRRSRRSGTQRAVSPEAQSTQQSTVATAEEVTTVAKPSRIPRRRSSKVEEPAVEAIATQDELDKNARRREERRRAKQQAPARSGVGRIVNTERMSGARKFYNDTASEIRKVVWPDRDTTRNLTLVVIVMSAIMGFLLGGIDFVLFRLFEAIT